jgi:hypothetical protein
MLYVDHTHGPPARKNRNREECFVSIFWKFIEKLEANILGRILGNRNRFAVLRDPAGDALSHFQLKAIDDLGVGIFGSAQHELIVFDNVDKAGITFYEGRGKFNNLRQNFVQRVSRCHPATYVMEKININVRVY